MSMGTGYVSRVFLAGKGRAVSSSEALGYPQGLRKGTVGKREEFG